MNEKLTQAMRNVFDLIRKNAIKVSYSPTKNNAPKSHSKFGGKPSVPLDFQWPYYKGKSYCDEVAENRPLAFLAEIHLPEVVGFDTDNLLPKVGVLSFFYEMETEKWGFDSEDKGCARVFYFEDESLLFENKFPENLNSDYQFPELSLSFEQKVSLPSYGDFYGTPQEKEISVKFPTAIDDCQYSDYDTLKEEYGCDLDGWGDITKLLGYPDVIQNPMEEECETVTRGFYQGNGEVEIPMDVKAEIRQASKDWILLFQMGTIENDNFELMFGDCGHIYFWIKKEDLLKRNFDKVWLILQCS